MQEADPRLIKLVRELDEERQRRVAAEKRATGLQSVLTRLQRERQRTADAKPQPEHRPSC